jgi:hypothetical protein
MALACPVGRSATPATEPGSRKEFAMRTTELNVGSGNGLPLPDLKGRCHVS